MNAGPATPESPLSDLTRVLWQQRRHLERLHYLLQVQELILAGGDQTLLQHAVNDVQLLVTTIGEIEAGRRELTAEIGISMGLDADASLEDLVNRAPEPYEQILAEHRDAFLALVSDITTVSLNGREQLQRGLNLTRELTSFVLGDSGDGGYDRSGAVVPGSAERGLIDRSL
jgi:FlgN protein